SQAAQLGWEYRKRGEAMSSRVHRRASRVRRTRRTRRIINCPETSNLLVDDFDLLIDRFVRNPSFRDSKRENAIKPSEDRSALTSELNIYIATISVSYCEC